MKSKSMLARSLEVKSSPPWQVFDLVAQFLDPKTLASAVCVCKSWAVSMSSDHLWQPFFSLHYPSLSNLPAAAATSTAVSYNKLYSLGQAAEKRRHQPPRKPYLSLQHLIFSIDIRNPKESVLTVVKHGGEVELDLNGSVFRFDIDVEKKSLGFEALNGLKITCNVVLEGFRSVFTMMDCEGKGRFVMGLEGWFSKELPSAGCCGGGGASGLVVDLRLGFQESGGKVVVEKMSVGVLSIVSWRYVQVDEVLRYLQHFLLPCNM